MIPWLFYFYSMQLETERLILRDIIEEDIDVIHQLLVLPETDQYNTLGIPQHRVVTAKWVEQYIQQQDQEPRKIYTFSIIGKQSGFMGLIALTFGDVVLKRAETWYKIHKHFWGYGYATEAVQGILDFGFNRLNLHRIEANCATGNTASIRVLEKAGFTQEGKRRKALPIRGEWYDCYDFGILSSEFQPY